MSDSSKVVAFKADGAPSNRAVNGTVPNRVANDALRTRDYLQESEVVKLISQAKKGRNPKRDALMINMAFRHGLRISELIDIRWSDLDLKKGTLHVRRLKGSLDSTHPVAREDLRALRALRKDSESPYVFTSERGSPMSAAGFRKQLARWGKAAKLEFPVNPHMLRHACGYALANKGVDTRSLQHYLGHKEISNTVRYTQLSAKRFDGMWD